MTKFLGILTMLLLCALVYCIWTIETQENKILVLSSSNEKLQESIQLKDHTISALQNLSDMKEELREERQLQDQVRQKITEDMEAAMREVFKNDTSTNSWNDAAIPDSWIRVLDEAQSRYGSSDSVRVSR